MQATSMNYKLLSGDMMPLIGFGTFQIHGRDLIYNVLDYALAAGYRSIDTAAVYGNEDSIGEALKKLLPKYNLKRQDIFVTSKLSPSDQGDAAYPAVKTSLKNLQFDFLDLYLIHWPGVSGVAVESGQNNKLRADSWKALVKAKNEGYVRNIGVSNYTVRHLSELLKNNHGEKPAVNQVEWHPHYHEDDLKRLCQQEGVLLQAYSSLGGSNNPRLITNPIVVEIAQRLQKSPAQVLLRWALQQNIAIIPKARSKAHIDANIDLNFEISASDMATLSNFKQSEKYAWDPKTVV